MIAKCQCQWCDGNIEFDAAEFQKTGDGASQILGQTVACPHCSKETILYLDKKETPKPGTRYGRIEKKTEFVGPGGLVQLIGLLLCLTCYGAIIGIPLIIYGSAMSRQWHCSECGIKLTSSKVKICPGCQCVFTN
jgi:hypothetical protein